MADDIVSTIRRTVGRVETYEHTPLMAVALSAADEIERLRALIRSYADTHDGITLNWSTDRKGHWDRFDAADKALLEEARRG